ncbi:DUF4112 domain-containing protein [Agaricicola taiwanensis]|nr:DUF4112 domain-containing protein [Agaricicola taiwanensis]
MTKAGTFEYYDAARDPDHSRLGTIERLDKLSRMLDSAWRIPGTNIRFGADAVMGLVPGIGDLAGAALSLYIVMEARRMKVPSSVLARMIGNIGLDTIVGAVPIAGSIFDVAYRANRRNVRILREHLESARR